MLLYELLLHSGLFKKQTAKGRANGAEAPFGIDPCMHNSIESPCARQHAFEEPLHKASVKVIASQLRITFRQQHNLRQSANKHGQLKKLQQILYWIAHGGEGSRCSPGTSDSQHSSCQQGERLAAGAQELYYFFTCCVQHFNDALKTVQQADVKGATAQVKHKDGCSF